MWGLPRSRNWSFPASNPGWAIEVIYYYIDERMGCFNLRAGYRKLKILVKEQPSKARELAKILSIFKGKWGSSNTFSK